MIKNNIAVLSVIYPIQKEIAYQFFDSLKDQSCSNFDVIIVNDGFVDFQDLSEYYPTLNIIEVRPGLSIVQNRKILIEKGLQLQYENFIFQDIDDFAHPSRIQIVYEKLNDYDIVVNDLAILLGVDVVKPSHFDQRISDGDRITISDVLDKNLFGLSNTACSSKVFSDINICWSDDIIALDWYIFSCALLSGWQAVFIGQSLTYYRQHEQNTAGLLQRPSPETATKVKLHHYAAMENYSVGFKKLLCETTHTVKHASKNNWWWE